MVFIMTVQSIPFSFRALALSFRLKSIFSKNLSVLTLALAIAANCANAQIPNDSIVADFNEFVRLLEETHPDPYSNYGGRPFFRKAAMETRFGLAMDSVTTADELPFSRTA